MSTVVVGTVRSNSSNPPTIQNTSGTEIGTFCRAWVNFNGTTVTNPASMTGVRGSFNVSSVLDNGTGDYTINFTTAMPDANYAVSFSVGQLSGGVSDKIPFVASIASSSVRVYVVQASFVDATNACVAIFR